MDLKHLFIVRHGNTFEAGERPRRIGARSDLPLTIQGEEQARQIGKWFAARYLSFDTALCGPLCRARRTASILLSELVAHPPLQIAPWLNEIDHGPDEGCDEMDVLARIGSDALQAWDRSAIVPQGWPIDAAAHVEMWRGAVKRLPAGRTLLVTSNGTVRFGLIALLPAERLPSSKLRTGAVGEIIIRGGDASLQAWNIRPRGAAPALSAPNDQVGPIDGHLS